MTAKSRSDRDLSYESRHHLGYRKRTLSGFAAANNLVGKTEAEIREVIGDKFPKHIYHSIICIGALVAHRDQGHWVISALGAPHVWERTEKQLITAFVGKIAELSPQLVTFNGSSFDLPVLRYRAMINEVAYPSDSGRLVAGMRL